MTDSVEQDAAIKPRGIRGVDDRLRLRQVLERDRAFLYGVFESTRAKEFARTGWSAQRIAQMLAEQFSMQDTYYRSHYPNGCFDVIELDGQPIGRLYHDWSGSEARLIDIALLPAYRGAGIGTRLMQAFVAHAAAKAMRIVLYVEMDNAVQALYRRLGFEAAGENGVYLQMQRPGTAFDGAQGMPVRVHASDGAT